MCSEFEWITVGWREAKAYRREYFWKPLSALVTAVVLSYYLLRDGDLP